MFRFFLLALLFWSPACLFAQEAQLLSGYRTDTAAFPRYHIHSLGIGQQTLRDPLLSALRYSGASVAARFNTLKFKPKFLTNSLLALHVNLLGNRSNGATIAQAGGSYSYSMLKKVKAVGGKKRSLYAGLQAEALFNYRLAINNTNNVFSYEGVVSLGATGLFQQGFRLLGREFILSDQLDVPLLSVVARPPYAWSYPAFLEETGRFSDGLKAGSWNQFFKVNNQVMLDFYTNVKHRHKNLGKRAWRLTYTWEYFAIPQLNKVQSGTSRLYFGKIIRF